MDSDEWDDRYASSELVWSAGPNQFVAAACERLTPGRAVDLAAGEGRNSLWLASRGWRVTAVDFSPVGLDKGAQVEAARAQAARAAAELEAPPIEWLAADATTWRGQGYDLAVVAYLQLPAKERAAASRNAFDALAPGGTLLLVAHDISNLTHGTGGPQDPALLPTAAAVLADLADREFEIVTAGVVDRPTGGGDGASHQHEGEPEAVAKDTLVQLTRR